MSRKITSKRRARDLVRRKVRRQENIIGDDMPDRDKTIGQACRRLHKGGLALNK